MSKNVIQCLQVFRGLAAIAVVAHHTAMSTRDFVRPLPDLAADFFVRGYLGVDFFFVLSGFIIMYAHMDDVQNSIAVRRYIWKRLTRIFPAYLPISLFLIGAYVAFPAVSAAGGREYSLISSILLLPSNEPPALSVAWTLVHEMQFYFVFALFFISKRLLVAVLILWSMGILLSNLFFMPASWLRYPLSPLNIEFMFGVFAAWGVKKSVFQFRPINLLILGCCVVLVSLWFIPQDGTAAVPRLAFAFGLAFIIIGFALIERKKVMKWPLPLLLIGNASYSIYLVHNPLLSITQRVAGYLTENWAGAMLLGLSSSLLAGYLYYVYWERPVLAFFRAKLGEQH